METAVLGVFLSLNLVLYYFFWEGMLIPMYFIIGIWGGPKRIYATIKFFLYTMVGSMVMLVSIIALYFASGSTTFDLPVLQQYVANGGHRLPRRDGDAAVRRFLPGVRHQGPDLAVPYLGAGCVR